MAKSPSGSKTLDLAELLHQATTLHQRGQFADAERCYRQVLNARRDHPEARHFLGILRFQQGRNAEALELIDAALKTRPDYAEAYYNRGNILAQLDRFEDALADYDQALALAGDYVEAHQNRGNVLLRLRRHADALASYDRVLARYPNQPDAHNNRGAALKELGRLDEALASYERAVAQRPDYVEAITNCGHALLELGRHREALGRYDAALALRPDDVEALGGRGKVLFALHHVDDALAKPDNPEALQNRGNVLSQLGRFEDALASYDQALALSPDNIETHQNRGNVLLRLGRRAEALACYDRVLALDPGRADAHNNRGAVLEELGQLDEALASYERAVARRPDYVEAITNCGHALMELGRHHEALARYDAALALNSRDPVALHARGVALLMLWRLDEALASLDHALTLRPGDPDTLVSRGQALAGMSRQQEALASYDAALSTRPNDSDALLERADLLHLMNRREAAVESYERALAAKPDFAKARLAACMAELPVLYRNDAEVNAQRAAYERKLGALRADAERGALDGLADAIGSYQPFFLGYQGYNDRDLQSMYGGMVCGLMSKRYPPLPSPPAPQTGERIRVGIVTGYFWRHTVWKILVKGWVEQLDRNRFEVLGYHTGSTQDQETCVASKVCERFVRGPLSVDGWRTAIAADQPHVLLYPDIGMDPMAAALAAQRLAPVQCNSWGHPDTSGFPTIDYFLSSDLMEPDNAEEHYTERLVRLPNIGVYYEPLDTQPSVTTRAELGLKTNTIVFWCGQSLFKYLPQDDDVFPRIAREVKGCQFVFIEHPKGPAATQDFRRRLDDAFRMFDLKAADHCVILARRDERAFAAAVGCCDIVLDSIGWSGFNTTIECLVHSLPVVTMKGPLMRGAHTAALLTMMDVKDTIASTRDNYVATAVRLACDQAWRSAVKDRMAANRHRVYRDRECITALEDFLVRVATSL